MKWIVLAGGQPRKLAVLLESAAMHMPATEADVFIDSGVSDDCFAIYRSLSRIRRAKWHFYSDFQEDLCALASEIRGNGTCETMLMLSLEDVQFCRTAILDDAWEILKRPDMLCVSMAAVAPAGASRSVRLHATKSIVHIWRWAEAAGLAGDAFQYGAVYRTSDLMGPLYHETYGRPDDLQEALCGCEAMHRRRHMVCPEEPVIISQ